MSYYIFHIGIYMLGPKKALGPCWNWDRIFAPCWNWDADSPVVAPARKTRAGEDLGRFIGWSRVLGVPEHQ